MKPIRRLLPMLLLLIAAFGDVQARTQAQDGVVPAVGEAQPLTTFQSTPVPGPPPTPPTPVPCLPPPPRRYGDGKPHRKILFVSGWAVREFLSRPVTPIDDHSGWNSIKEYLIERSKRTETPLGDEDFIYFSYSGNYECNANNQTDYAKPIYYWFDTPLGLWADYDRRAEILEEILNAFPEDEFDIITHSNGGVVTLYWAATRLLSPIPQALNRVNSVTTLDSPVAGWPGGCGVGLPAHPKEVITKLADALTRVRVLTVANENDTVVRPSQATIPDVWRHREDNFGIGLGWLPPCDAEGHGLVKEDIRVHDEIGAAVWPAHIYAPNHLNSFSAGLNTNPKTIEISVTYPTSKDLARQLSDGQTDAVGVTIGDRPAQVLEVKDLFPVLRMYRLRVLPPRQPTGGKYDLRVQIGAESDTQRQAVEYLDAVTAPPGARAATTTALVFDVSGSMEMADTSGKQKIRAAQEAARLVTRMIRRENEQQGTDHRVGVVAFSDQAGVLQSLISTVADAEQAIVGLAPEGGTNLAAGLAAGTRQLQEDGSQSRKILILLSDGVPTVYLDGRQAAGTDELPALKQEVLAQVEAVDDCLYVVGFGDPDETVDGWPSIDETFLRQIATAGPCGGYYLAGTAAELANIYVRLRHESTGTVAGEQSGEIAQGETTPPFAIDVPPKQSELHLTLNWPGSRLDLLLADPQGRRVDSSYPGATLFTDEPPVYFIIRNPPAGTWRVQVHGAEVPEGVTSYNVVASTRGATGDKIVVVGPSASFDGSVVLLFVVLLAALGAGWWVYQSSTRPSGARLIVDGDHNRALLLPGAGAVIGRDPRSGLVLHDPRVSARHAEIRRQGAAWVLSDLGSANGTFVNGRRVHQHVLRPGDEIRVGETVLWFYGE